MSQRIPIVSERCPYSGCLQSNELFVDLDAPSRISGRKIVNGMIRIETEYV